MLHPRVCSVLQMNHACTYQKRSQCSHSGLSLRFLLTLFHKSAIQSPSFSHGDLPIIYARGKTQINNIPEHDLVTLSNPSIAHCLPFVCLALFALLHTTTDRARKLVCASRLTSKRAGLIANTRAQYVTQACKTSKKLKRTVMAACQQGMYIMVVHSCLCVSGRRRLL